MNAPNKEEVHVICGPDLFGPEATGRIAIIVRALYGLRSAGNAWRHHFANKSAPGCDEVPYYEFRDVCDLTLHWLKRNSPIFPGAMDRIAADIFDEEIEDDPTLITSNELAVIMEMESAVLIGARRNDKRVEM